MKDTGAYVTFVARTLHRVQKMPHRTWRDRQARYEALRDATAEWEQAQATKRAEAS